MLAWQEMKKVFFNFQKSIFLDFRFHDCLKFVEHICMIHRRCKLGVFLDFLIFDTSATKSRQFFGSYDSQMQTWLDFFRKRFDRI